MAGAEEEEIKWLAFPADSDAYSISWPTEEIFQGSDRNFDLCQERWSLEWRPTSYEFLSLFIVYRGAKLNLWAVLSITLTNDENEEFKAVMDGYSELPFSACRGHDRWGRNKVTTRKELESRCKSGNVNINVKICMLKTQAGMTEATTRTPDASLQYRLIKAPSMALEMAAVFAKAEDADVTFHVGKPPKQIKAHRSIIAARCPVPIATGLKVKLYEYDPAVIQEFLFFVYTDGCRERKLAAVADRLLPLAHRTGLEALKCMCEICLAKSIDIDNCCERLLLAEDTDSEGLKAACSAFAAKNALGVKGSEGYKRVEIRPHLLPILFPSNPSTNG